jgi:hypothetical protein
MLTVTSSLDGPRISEDFFAGSICSTGVALPAMPGPPLLILFLNHNIYSRIVPVLNGFSENIRKSLNLSASKLLLAAIF